MIKIHNFLITIISTGLYLGKMPFMPGTFGSLLAIPLGYLFTFIPSLKVKITIVIISILIGIYTSDRYAKLIGKDDPGEIVVDEYLALLIFYIIFPFKPIYIIAGFILFRIYDITKPFPIKHFEALHGGVGIMLDDIIAVVYAIITFMIIKKLYEVFI